KPVLKQSIKTEPEAQPEQEKTADKPAEDNAEVKPAKPRGRRKHVVREPKRARKESPEQAAPDKESEKEAPAKAKESEAAPEAAQKAEINAVRRDILEFAAANENASLSQLGTVLSQKYGKGYLKELGHSSIKKLLSGMPGISVKGNTVSISEEFAARTAEIESFVNEFARGEGSHSIRALGIKLRKRFEGFNFGDYGFEKFTDFINAIDGVKADRYHISPVDQ
ncbi:MAG: hypothetical protein K2G32_02460, partial [Oscillospiraceae bacterium]|nr:hypothetical protein [Oscillospiraceae bacterium]